MSEPAIDLDTAITRDQQVRETAGSIQVAADDAAGSQVVLSFGDDREITYVALTPTEARAVATALEHEAVRADAADTSEATTDE